MAPAEVLGSGVPLLDDLAVLQPEDVRRSGAAVAGRGLQQAVRHDEVALGDRALDLDAQVWELGGEASDELDERLGAVGRLRVVLDVARADVLGHRVLGLLVVERLGVEGEHRLLVLLVVGHPVPPFQRRAGRGGAVRPGQFQVSPIGPVLAALPSAGRPYTASRSAATGLKGWLAEAGTL